MKFDPPPPATQSGHDGTSRAPDAPWRPAASQARYWRHNLGLVASLLVLWFVVTFVVAFHARDLAFDFFGWPFSFWVGAQGALVTYWLITAVYARSMNRLEKRRCEGEWSGAPAREESGSNGPGAVAAPQHVNGDI